MALLGFILVNAGFAVVDGLVTFLMADVFNVDVIFARLAGSSIAFAGLACVLVRLHRSKQSSSFLTISISGVAMLVSFGLFALILTRNSMLQWPAAFIAASVAALMLGGFGYHRAIRRAGIVI